MKESAAPRVTQHSWRNEAAQLLGYAQINAFGHMQAICLP
jgi:hypothetical protein